MSSELVTQKKGKENITRGYDFVVNNASNSNIFDMRAFFTIVSRAAHLNLIYSLYLVWTSSNLPTKLLVQKKVNLQWLLGLKNYLVTGLKTTSFSSMA